MPKAERVRRQDIDGTRSRSNSKVHQGRERGDGPIQPTRFTAHVVLRIGQDCRGGEASEMRVSLAALEAAEAEVRRLKAELGRAHEDREQLRAQLAGRDQEIRALREKLGAKGLQVGGAEAGG